MKCARAEWTRSSGLSEPSVTVPASRAGSLQADASGSRASARTGRDARGGVAAGQSPRPTASACCRRRRRRAPGADRPRRRLRRPRRPSSRTARRAGRNRGSCSGHALSVDAYSRPRGIAVAARTIAGHAGPQSSLASSLKRILKMSREDWRARTLLRREPVRPAPTSVSATRVRHASCCARSGQPARRPRRPLPVGCRVTGLCAGLSSSLDAGAGPTRARADP